MTPPPPNKKKSNWINLNLFTAHFDNFCKYIKHQSKTQCYNPIIAIKRKQLQWETTPDEMESLPKYYQNINKDLTFETVITVYQF